MKIFIADFRKKGHPVPTEIMSNLKAAKTAIKISKADECYGESAQKIEEYLANLEAYLISEGQKAFGNEYADEWLRRLDEARKRLPEKEEEENHRHHRPLLLIDSRRHRARGGDRDR